MKITPEIQADAVSLLETASAAVDTFADRHRIILGVGDRSTLAASLVIALGHRSNPDPAESPAQKAPGPNQAAMIDELRTALQRIPTAAETSQLPRELLEKFSAIAVALSTAAAALGLEIVAA